MGGEDSFPDEPQIVNTDTAEILQDQRTSDDGILPANVEGGLLEKELIEVTNDNHGAQIVVRTFKAEMNDEKENP